MDSFPCNAHWADYIHTLNKLGIPEEKVNFYLMWAKRYVRFLKGFPVDQASTDMVQAFLLGKGPWVEAWQIRQAGDAVARFHFFIIKRGHHAALFFPAGFISWLAGAGCYRTLFFNPVSTF
jgi:hypothetical protein